jgi:predicted dehydrogenase
MRPIRFGIIGGGWRAQFYLRIAQLLPDVFQVGGMLVRNADKGRDIEDTWGISTYRDLDELLRVADIRFAVVSLPWEASPPTIQELARHNMPALAETPPAPDVESLQTLYKLVQQGAKIQVAEQYHLQPLHAARLAIIRSGKLGTISQVQVSAAHGYHGLSLLRRMLGITFENATISARSFTSPLTAGPDRNGPPAHEEITQSTQVIAQLDFGAKLGIYDFTDEQYFSWIRSQRILVRGERGEINNTQVRYLEDARTPITLELTRQNAGEDGNLEGYYHKGILAGNEWVYTNPLAPARLSDDEIAIAHCLSKMGDYLEGGPELYSLAEAAQDHYFNLIIKQALTSSQPITTTTQPWAL